MLRRFDFLHFDSTCDEHTSTADALPGVEASVCHADKRCMRMAMLIYLNAQCSGECTICGIRAQSHNTSIEFSLKSTATSTLARLSPSLSPSSSPPNDAYKRAKSIYKINEHECGACMEPGLPAIYARPTDGHTTPCFVSGYNCEMWSTHSTFFGHSPCMCIHVYIVFKVLTQRTSLIRGCAPPPFIQHFTLV